MQDIFKTKIKYYQKQPLEVFYKEKLFLKFLQSSQKNTCVGVSFQYNCKPWQEA